MKYILTLLAMLLIGCSTPTREDYGPVWRDDGSDIPPPAYTNIPAPYLGVSP